MDTPDAEVLKDCLTELCIQEMNKSRVRFMEMFGPKKKPSLYDDRGVHIGKTSPNEINWFKYLTPLGRLKALNRRARVKRGGMGSINITFSREVIWK